MPFLVLSRAGFDDIASRIDLAVAVLAGHEMHLPRLGIAVGRRALRILQHGVDLVRCKGFGQKWPARLPLAHQVVK